MKKPSCSRYVRFFVLAGLAWLTALSASAQTVAASAAPAAPTNEERIAALEAYVTNNDPGKALTGVPGPGHNAWMMTSSALVLFMTLPGLALFYGGLVRRKNVLSVLAQCLGITGLVALLWWAFGYSFVFGKSAGSSVFGGWEHVFLRGVGAAPNTDYAFWVSHSVFAMYQMMFAIITPALIIGAIAERMKYSAVLLFVAIWMVVVYFPLAHMVWGATGLMNGVWNGNATIRAIDFAGGMVVHISAGFAALALAMVIGKRAGYGQYSMEPHIIPMTLLGAGLLWFGWFGFNAGSALAVNASAVTAFVNTNTAAAAGALAWMFASWYHGKPSSLGMVSGAIAGMVAITPAAGFVSPLVAILIGAVAGVLCFAMMLVRIRKQLDESLDAWAIHGMGGLWGTLATGLFAAAAVAGFSGFFEGNVHQLVANTVGAFAAVIYAFVMTFIIAWIIDRILGLRVTPDEEYVGLDICHHGERA